MSERENDSAMSDAALLKQAVFARQTEYQELSQVWRDLDSKAQSSIPLIGILLAAFIAFVTRSDAHLATAEAVLAAIEVLLLMASAVLLLFALSVREYEGPPHFGNIQSMVQDFLPIPSYQRSARYEDLLRQELVWWEKTNDSVRSETEGKGKRIFWGHLMVGFAIVLLAVFALIQIVELRNGDLHKVSTLGGTDGPAVLLNLRWQDGGPSENCDDQTRDAHRSALPSRQKGTQKSAEEGGNPGEKGREKIR